MKPASAIGCPSGILTCAGQILTGWNYYTTFESGPELPPPPLGPSELNFLDHEAIKAFQGGICVNTYLDEEDKKLLNKGNVSSQDWNNIPNKFKFPDGKAEGCVAVSWYKETWAGGRWRGPLRYEWLYKLGGETLVVYGIYNPDDMTLKLSWRAIYINRKTQKTAWNAWYREKQYAPKNPVFLSGLSWLWGYSPVWGNSCKWMKDDCNREGSVKTYGETKLTWKEDDKGEQLFTDWTLNFWDAFGDFIKDSDNPLTEFHNLAKREGTWSKR